MEEKKVTIEDLKDQLEAAKQQMSKMYSQMQKMAIDNSLNMQSFMIEIVKLNDTFIEYERQDVVKNAINAINDFWFKEEAK